MAPRSPLKGTLKVTLNSFKEPKVTLKATKGNPFKPPRGALKMALKSQKRSPLFHPLEHRAFFDEDLGLRPVLLKRGGGRL